MRIAFIGCGYVADFYVHSLSNHPELELTGVYDRNEDRLRRFAQHFKVHAYGSFEELLSDPKVELVVNLTNPRSHYEISKSVLERGKHVYSEKPLAMRVEEARELTELAEKRQLLLACAPCNVLSETAQTMWKTLREGQIGRARLVFAELHEGLITDEYKEWRSESGTQWPADDEFETGCTLEHVGYYLGWLTSFFGPAIHVASFGRVLNRDKGASGQCATPDYTVGNIEFASGVVARISCSLYAPKEHLLRIIGDDGVLWVEECWDYGAPVYIEGREPKLWREKHPKRASMLGLSRPKIPLVREPKEIEHRFGHRMEWCRGIAELAAAVDEKRKPRMSARWSLHVSELALAISNGYSGPVESTFEPMEPMAWAR
jgi:predicted dehydrogenase